jgi:hypothetical protein
VSEPIRTSELEIALDYGQIYLYDAGAGIDFPSNVVLDALNEALQSRRYVGVAGGVIDLLSPVQFNVNAPMRLELWAGEPSDDHANWDHVVDIDMDAPTGQLRFEASGGWEPIAAQVPPGLYRARLAGRGYNYSNPQGGGLDGYRLQLWPRTTDADPTLVKLWSGWATLNL